MDLMITLWTEQTQKSVVVCTVDWSSIGIKQFLYFTHKDSEKRIDIRCQVTFGFKYISLSIADC